MTYRRNNCRWTPASTPTSTTIGKSTTGDYFPEQHFSEAYVSSSSTTHWVIVVQMHDGSMLPIFQKFEPLLQVGDPVVVDANTIKLWN